MQAISGECDAAELNEEVQTEGAWGNKKRDESKQSKDSSKAPRGEMMDNEREGDQLNWHETEAGSQITRSVN